MRLLNLAAAFAAALLGAAGAQAQDRAVPQSRAQVQLSYAAVVKEAAPSVVNVYGARVERRQQNAAMEEFMRRFFGDGGPGGPGGPGAPDGFQGRGQRSLGSGVIVDASGLVVTNHHVVEGMTEVKIALADKREFEATIVLSDPRTDLAVLKAKGAPPLHALEFGDSEGLQVGDLVLAIGNPFGVGQTVTHGIVSALARTQVGDLGLPVLHPDRRRHQSGQFRRRAGRHRRPARRHQHGDLLALGRQPRHRLRHPLQHGAQPWSNRRRAAAARCAGPGSAPASRTSRPTSPISLGLERPTGALVASTSTRARPRRPGSSAATSSLRSTARTSMTPESLRLPVLAQGRRRADEPHRAARRRAQDRGDPAARRPPETRPREPVRVKARSPLAGATVVNMSPAVADELQLDISLGGRRRDRDRTELERQRVGFQKGDVILAINGEPVKTSKDVERARRRPAARSGRSPSSAAARC